MQWKDSTSYSRSRPRIATTWSVVLTKDVSVTITNDHIYHPGKWVMHCRPWYDIHPLGDDIAHVTEAQEKALALVRARVAELAAVLGEG
jgi:hypothetical protein